MVGEIYNACILRRNCHVDLLLWKIYGTFQLDFEVQQQHIFKFLKKECVFHKCK